MNFTREISLTDITNLNISSSINVEYVKSDNQYAIAMSDTQKGLDLIELTQKDDNLIISPLPTEVLLENDIAIVVGSNESINGLEALEK